jgi:integrase/recombinase XerC
MKNGVMKANQVRLVTRPKLSRRLPEVYREDSLETYLAGTQCLVDEPEVYADPKYYDRRLGRLVINLLYCTGMRRAELIGLNRRDFDPQRRTLRVHGKGDKIREIPLVVSLCKEILLYLQSVDSLKCADKAPEAPLLQTPRGARLYPVYVDRAVKAALGQVGSISGRKSPHVLRHTLATELLDGGADLNSIKELLGHSSLAATQVYTHNSIERLQKVYKSAHPRAKNDGNHGD